ncbi:MAG: RimK/LysX family protein [Rhodothermaceae bacterium]|nr:RimK/LysX family protein [Rhodothermaceae bacterium]
MKPNEKTILGRREFIDFPDLGLTGIEAKIDTGAYTSSIHCHDITIHSGAESKLVAFKLLDPDHPAYEHRILQLPLVKQKIVRSSSGDEENRAIIRTTVRIGGHSFLTDLSLTDRSGMDYPVLLGRKAIRKRFIVDVAKVHIAGNDVV